MNQLFSQLRFILSLGLSLSLFAGHAQSLLKVEGYPIGFTTDKYMEYLPSEEPGMFIYDNEAHMVLFMVVSMEDESKEFLDDLKDGAREIATDMSFEDIKNGGKIPGIESSYYITATDAEENIPVYVLAILDEEVSTAYEIVIYCYVDATEECEKLVKSFTLLR